jgi:hypothetical protein
MRSPEALNSETKHFSFTSTKNGDTQAQANENGVIYINSEDGGEPHRNYQDYGFSNDYGSFSSDGNSAGFIFDDGSSVYVDGLGDSSSNSGYYDPSLYGSGYNYGYPAGVPATSTYPTTPTYPATATYPGVNQAAGGAYSGAAGANQAELLIYFVRFPLCQMGQY